MKLIAEIEGMAPLTADSPVSSIPPTLYNSHRLNEKTHRCTTDIMTDFLNAKVGTAERKLKVKSITKKTVNLKDGNTSEKIVFHTVEEGTGRKFEISDSYVNDPNGGGNRIAGLWYSQNKGKINQASALAKVMEYYGAGALKDLIGKDVIAYPDSNNYLVLTACDIN